LNNHKKKTCPQKDVYLQTAYFTIIFSALTTINYTIHLKSCPLYISLTVAVHVQKFWKCYKSTHDYNLCSVVVWKYYEQYRRLQRWSHT